MVDFASARRAMVETQLRARGVLDHRVLGVMAGIPRERFVPPYRRELAYIDDLHPLGQQGSGRFLADAATFGRLVQLADLQEGDEVLDMGAGSGYSTAVLAGLAARVVAIEPDPALAREAADTLSSLGVGNAEFASDLAALGDRRFDVILIEGSVPSVSEDLLERLLPGGRLVGVVQSGRQVGTATLFVAGQAGIGVTTHFNAALPPLSNAPVPQEFVF